MFKIYRMGLSGYELIMKKDSEQEVHKFLCTQLQGELDGTRFLVIERVKGTDYIYGAFSRDDYSRARLESVHIRRRKK